MGEYAQGNFNKDKSPTEVAKALNMSLSRFYLLNPNLRGARIIKAGTNFSTGMRNLQAHIYANLRNAQQIQKTNLINKRNLERYNQQMAEYRRQKALYDQRLKEDAHFWGDDLSPEQREKWVQNGHAQIQQALDARDKANTYTFTDYNGNILTGHIGQMAWDWVNEDPTHRTIDNWKAKVKGDYNSDLHFKKNVALVVGAAELSVPLMGFTPLAEGMYNGYKLVNTAYNGVKTLDNLYKGDYLGAFNTGLSTAASVAGYGSSYGDTAKNVSNALSMMNSTNKSLQDGMKIYNNLTSEGNINKTELLGNSLDLVSNVIGMKHANNFVSGTSNSDYSKTVKNAASLISNGANEYNGTKTDNTVLHKLAGPYIYGI